MGAPLHFAAQDKAMVSTLLNHKANPNMVVFDAFSPLMMAISLQSFDCVKLLLKGGADPNLTPSLTKLGMTPLGSAVMEGTTEIIKLLLQAGADPNKTDVYGLIPIEIAAILKNCSEAAEVLFPLTSPNPKVRNWSFDGIKEYVNSVGHIIERDMINQERFLMFKSKGKDAVNRKDYAEAMVWYSMANDMAPTDAAVLSNRSLCWARLKVGEEALNDARECLKLSPNWSKAYYRAGIAWNLLKDFQKAADMFAAGLQLDPENKELCGAFSFCVHDPVSLTAKLVRVSAQVPFYLYFGVPASQTNGSASLSLHFPHLHNPSTDRNRAMAFRSSPISPDGDIFPSRGFKLLRPLISNFSGDPGAAHFLSAAYSGDLQLVRGLASALGEPVESVKDDQGRTAFHYAAVGGKTLLCKYFLDELRLPVDIRDAFGETPLHQAILGHHNCTAEYLLDNNADPNAATDDQGFTPLHYAAGIGSKRSVLLLMSKGAEVNAKSSFGTPLHFGAGNEGIVKTLLHYNADPNIAVFQAYSPLVSSIIGRCSECVKLLLKAGADPNLIPSLSLLRMSPLDAAVMQGNTEIIKQLLRAGADPNATNAFGMKPIEIAAFKNRPKAAEVLFPVSSPNPDVLNWTYDGIKQYVDSDEQASKRDIICLERYLLFKSRGKEAVTRNDYSDAVFWYTQASEAFPPDAAAMLSNRSLCWARLKEGEEALSDAHACMMLRPDWPKAYYREGIAWNLLKEFRKAAKSFAFGLRLDSSNRDLQDALREALASAAAAAAAAAGNGYRVF
ncbi:unnamed protein product [Linum tenue]|nr:unnamed protein product [Linum tenue]